MSNYLGRGIDQIDNISTLDNLTFNGSLQTFNLTQNSVAFVPVSADALQIMIDGILQSNNYTVSGSTVTFDFTPSGSSVCNGIKHFGVGIITSVSDGAITNVKLGADSVNGSKIADSSISDEHLDITAITGQTAITSLADTDKFLVSDASDSGNLKYVEKQYLPSGIFNQITSVNGSASTVENIIDNCFSSTYRNYFITCEKISISNSSSKCEFRLRTGGGSGAYAGNNMGGASQGWLGGSNSEMTQQKVNSGIFPLTNNTYQDDDFAFHFYIFNPYATNERTIVSGRSVYREGSTSYVGFNDFGFLSISTENHTGFAINSSSAQFNAGARITVYGITDPS